jgi:DNA-binding transcriptional LysR family regulator
METLANLESFVRSAEFGGFSAAARRLGLTPAAVSRNVATLESNLGVRLFQRSTRKLTLTEAGERFLHSVSGGLESLQAAIAGISAESGEPAGLLKVSMGQAFGMDYILPMLPAFRLHHPAVGIDWHFENRQVDLIAEGYDAAIGGGFELTQGLVARELARVHVVAVAAPAYMAGKSMPQHPDDLAAFDGIVMRSIQTGRVRSWPMQDAGGRQSEPAVKSDIALNDPEAVCRAALLGLGVAMVALPHALPHLESGRLLRLLPDWHADVGAISLYFASRTLLPAKTRAFVDFIAEQFRRQDLAQRFSA